MKSRVQTAKVTKKDKKERTHDTLNVAKTVP